MAVANIRAIFEMSKQVSDEPGVILEFLSAVNDLDTLWTQIVSEDDSVRLYYLIILDKVNGYVAGTSAEVGALIYATKAVDDQVKPKGIANIYLSYINYDMLETGLY